MITTRNAYLYINKDNKRLDASCIELHSRQSGAYLEASFSSNEKIVKDDVLQVFYVDEDENEELMATLTVFSVPRLDSRNVIYASDPFRDRMKAIVPSSAWRKATAEEIAKDVMSACDIDDYDVSVLSSVTLPHFSCHDQNGWTVLKALLNAVNAAASSNLVILPTKEGVLTITELKDFTTTMETETIFSTDITKLGTNRLNTHLLGLLYGQKVVVEGEERLIGNSVMATSKDERSTVLCLI